MNSNSLLEIAANQRSVKTNERSRTPLAAFKLGLGSLTVALFSLSAIAATKPCRIEVIEQGSGWPVPLVELRTTHNVRFITDNAGVIAFDLPELMGRETWFDVIGNGYEVPKDGFGMRGVRLKPEPGKTLKVEVTRTIVAKRLGRLTGGGIFGESQKCGAKWIGANREFSAAIVSKTRCIAGNFSGLGATRPFQIIRSAFST